MKRYFWLALGAVSGIYIFIPEFTDVIPVIGWLDEATAFGLMLYAFKKGGFDLSRFFGKDTKKGKTIFVDSKK